VKRNHDRFPEDFMFRLTRKEVDALNRSQFATGSQKHRDPRYPPYAFTEHGAVMLASVLNSPMAVQASTQVVRAFIRLCEILATHKDLIKEQEIRLKIEQIKFKTIQLILREKRRIERGICHERYLFSRFSCLTVSYKIR
jgi:hypothetical protein